MIKNKLHIERLKKIRPFVDFNFNINSIKAGNISEYEKRKIKIYYDEINKLTAHPHYIYRPRRKDHKDAAREYANQDNLRGMKNVILPTQINGQRPELKFKNNKLKVIEEFTEKEAAIFDKSELFIDPLSEIERVKKELSNSDKFTVMCGKHEGLRDIGDKNTINSIILDYMNKYKNSDEWLNGLYGYKVKNQSTFNEFINAKKESKLKFQAVRKRDRNRNKQIERVDFALETTTDAELRNQLIKRKNNLKNLLGK